MKAFSLFTLMSLLIFSTGFTEVNQQLIRTLDYVKGHQDFKNLFFKEHEKEFMRLVNEGQAPNTCFISCSDSRVVPELIAQAMPGQFFVIRTAGNFVPTYDQNISWDGVAATIEYAVEVLKVKDIIVCGHSHCGAIQGLFSADIEKNPKYQILSRWLRFGLEAKKITIAALDKNAPASEMYQVAERVSILSQLDHLMTYPFIKKKVEDKEIYLHGWHFSIETGQITFFNPENYRFMPLSEVSQVLNPMQKK